MTHLVYVQNWLQLIRANHLTRTRGIDRLRREEALEYLIGYIFHITMALICSADTNDIYCGS